MWGLLRTCERWDLIWRRNIFFPGTKSSASGVTASNGTTAGKRGERGVAEKSENLILWPWHFSSGDAIFDSGSPIVIQRAIKAWCSFKLSWFRSAENNSRTTYPHFYACTELSRSLHSGLDDSKHPPASALHAIPRQHSEGMHEERLVVVGSGELLGNISFGFIFIFYGIFYIPSLLTFLKSASLSANCFFVLPALPRVLGHMAFLISIALSYLIWSLIIRTDHYFGHQRGAWEERHVNQVTASTTKIYFLLQQAQQHSSHWCCK